MSNIASFIFMTNPESPTVQYRVQRVGWHSHCACVRTPLIMMHMHNSRKCTYFVPLIVWWDVTCRPGVKLKNHLSLPSHHFLTSLS